MVNENDRLPDEDEENEDSSDQDSSSSESQQTGVDIEQLVREVAALKTQNTRAIQSFNASVGRLQALYDKLESGRGDTDKLVAQIRSQVTAVDTALEAVLEDDSLDDKVRVKASQARSKVAGDSELAALKAEIEALKAGKTADTTRQQEPDPLLSFEDQIVSEIESYGLNPDDDAFDWKGEATTLLKTRGADATRAYFRGKIKELVASQGATGRRQEKKEAGSKSTKPSGTNMRDLDPSLPIEDRLKKLRDMGIIN